MCFIASCAHQLFSCASVPPSWFIFVLPERVLQLTFQPGSVAGDISALQRGGGMRNSGPDGPKTWGSISLAGHSNAATAQAVDSVNERTVLFIPEREISILKMLSCSSGHVKNQA